MKLPSFVTMQLFKISSDSSNWSFLHLYPKTLQLNYRYCLHILEECLEHTLEDFLPYYFHPFFSTVSPKTEPSTFPPEETATSTITLPCMLEIISSDKILGAGLPKTCAVVITISEYPQTFSFLLFVTLIVSLLILLHSLDQSLQFHRYLFL